MKIIRIHLKNGYKRFYDLTIDLGDDPKRIIALVGPNGCGKSSVFDGMLYRNNVFSQIGNKGSKDYNYHSLNKAPDYGFDNIEIDFTTGSFDTIRALKQKTGKENTIFSFRSSYRYNSNLKVTTSQAIPEIRLNNYGASTSSDLDDKMEQNYRRLNVKFNKYIKDNPTTATYDLTKAKIIGDLNASLTKCLDLEIAGIGDIEDNKGTLYFKKKDHVSEFEFNVLSSGEKEIVDMLLDLYLRQDDYNDSIFLIDEPELHINTSIQRSLILEINKLVGMDCQIWLATHSIGFLRALQDELKDECQIIEFPPNIDWASTVQILHPIKKSFKKWKDLFETALDDLTGLVSPKRIVYCEGKDKPGPDGREKGLDAQVLNNIFGEQYPDTLFISSGGNTELDQRSEIALAILSKVFSDVDLLVFKDRDVSSGKANTEADRLLYLENNPQNFRIMKRWEIENYLFDKEVIKAYCRDNSLTLNEAGYDKFVTDIQNQNLKDETGKIKSLCGITTSINPETFKTNLSKKIDKSMSVYQELEECIFNRK